MSTPPSKKKKEVLLPTEVITEIMSKLPTMSVLRFHGVSKQWSNILIDEYFQNLHSEVLLRFGHPLPFYPKILFSTVHMQKQQQQLIITLLGLGSISHHTIRVFSHTNNCKAISPGGLNGMQFPAMQCNGLMCIALDKSFMVGMVPKGRLKDWPIIVCNPLTLEYLALPPCTSAHATQSCCGLGFAPLSKQYKVVWFHFVQAPSKPPYFNVLMMEVYSLGDTGWRVVPHIGFNQGLITRYDGVYANGKIYWVFRVHRFRLLSFDVESERASAV